MARKNTDTGDLHEQEIPESMAEEPVEVVLTLHAGLTPAEKKYIGPAYKFGIVIPGTTTQVDPRNMTEKERDALVAIYPEAAAWWE